MVHVNKIMCSDDVEEVLELHSILEIDVAETRGRVLCPFLGTLIFKRWVQIGIFADIIFVLKNAGFETKSIVL